MEFDPKIHHRHSIRLKGYDYAQAGLYFVTVVTRGRVPLFGEILDGEMHLNRCGEIVQRAWFDLPRHYSNAELGAFVIMPNHVHGIIILDDDRRGGSASGRAPESDRTITGLGTLLEETETRPYGKYHGLSEIVRAFKSFSARRINRSRRLPGVPVWQRNYYEHIIRNQQDLELTWL
jgi:putative transposase